MSYDLMVFEADVAPAERDDFLSWFFRTVRLQDGHLTMSPAVASPTLQAWYRDLTRVYPPAAGPDVPPDAMGYDVHNTDYRFAENAVFARFNWEVSRLAYRRALKLAKLHGVGFFDASGDTAAVWTPATDGRYLMRHRGDKLVIKD